MPRGTGSKIHCTTALADTAVLVQTGKCSLTWYHILNTTTVEGYFMLYDAAAAADVTLGTTAPNAVLGIPAETAAGLGAGACAGLDRPLQFTKGLVIAALDAVTGHGAGAMCVSLGVGE